MSISMNVHTQLHSADVQRPRHNHPPHRPPEGGAEVEARGTRHLGHGVTQIIDKIQSGEIDDSGKHKGIHKLMEKLESGDGERRVGWSRSDHPHHLDRVGRHEEVEFEDDDDDDDVQVAQGPQGQPFQITVNITINGGIAPEVREEIDNNTGNNSQVTESQVAYAALEESGRLFNQLEELATIGADGGVIDEATWNQVQSDLKEQVTTFQNYIGNGSPDSAESNMLTTLQELEILSFDFNAQLDKEHALDVVDNAADVVFNTLNTYASADELKEAHDAAAQQTATTTSPLDPAAASTAASQSASLLSDYTTAVTTQANLATADALQALSA